MIEKPEEQNMVVTGTGANPANPISEMQHQALDIATLVHSLQARLNSNSWPKL